MTPSTVVIILVFGALAAGIAALIAMYEDSDSKDKSKDDTE